MNVWRSYAGRFLFVTVVMGLATAFAWDELGRPLHGVDDANIFMVYARHLAHGEGLVYNGGGERVEGFTSLLYVLVSAPLFLRPAEDGSGALLLLLLVVSAALAWLALQLDRLEGAGPLGPAALFALGWVLASPAYPAWCVLSLMDTGLWSALVLSFVLAATRAARSGRPRALAVLTAALLLARPEATAFVPLVLCATLALRRRAGGSGQQAWRVVLPALASYAVTLGGLTVFRLAYFGSPLPNTYYAKVSPSLAYNLWSGLRYLGQFSAPSLVVRVGLALTLLALVLAATRLWHGQDRAATAEQATGFTFAVAACVLGALPLLTGGDHFVWSRFYQPVWPLMAVPVWVVAVRPALELLRASVGAARISRWLVLPVLALLVLDAQPSWLGGNRDLAAELRGADAGRRNGAALSCLFAGQPAPSVGVISSGGIKFGYAGPVVDLMGLNHTAMAHSPGDRRGKKNHAAFDKGVFYAASPQLVLPELLARPQARNILIGSFDDKVLQGTFHDEAFAQRYQFASLRRPSCGNGWIVGYVRRDFLDRLGDDPGLEVHLTQR